MLSRYTHSDVRPWLGQGVSDELVEKVLEKINAPGRERTIRNPDSTVDYGYSFNLHSENQQACLKRIRELHDNGSQPHVADIGAGFGEMTWKMLLAGASVDSFEIQAPTAHELEKRLKEMAPSFFPNIDINSVHRTIIGNALLKLNALEFTEKYDVIWTGNFLHFLTPDELNQFAILCQKALKPGGKLFCVANSLFSQQDRAGHNLIVETYNRSEAKGNQIPGFMCYNSITVQLLDLSVGAVHKAYAIISTYTIDEMRANGIPIKANAYVLEYTPSPMDKKTAASHNTLMGNLQSQGVILGRNPHHQTLTFLKREDAAKLFCGFGFYHVNSYYEKPASNHQITHDPRLEDGCLNLAFSLVKPHTGLKKIGLFKVGPHESLLHDAKSACENAKSYTSYLEALKKKDYALALRKACSEGNKPLVMIILTYYRHFNFDINATSSNGNTALDWLKASKVKSNDDRRAMLDALIACGAASGKESPTAKLETQTSLQT